MSNQRFAEYATSGAFQLSLSRNQVSALAMIAGGAGAGFGLSATTLERKGLVEIIADPDGIGQNMDRVQFRASTAGLLCAALLSEAGLTNGPEDPVTAELASLRTELEQRRIEAAECRRSARSAMARMQEAESELAQAQREVGLLKTQLETGLRWKGGDLRRPLEVRLRDPDPERTNDQLMADIQEPAE